jgi:hypothetical protein
MTINQFFQKYDVGLNVNYSADEIAQYATNFKNNTGIAWEKYGANAKQRVDSKVVSDTDPNVVGHAVMIVGWGKDNNVPGYGPLEYWIVQNSWGDDWNDNGYFKIAFSQQLNSDGVYASKPDPLNPGKFINQGIGLDLMTQPDNYGGTYTWVPCISDKNRSCLSLPLMPTNMTPTPSTPSPPSPPSQPPSQPPSLPSGPVYPPSPSNNMPITPPPTPPSPPAPLDNMFPNLPFFTPDQNDDDYLVNPSNPPVPSPPLPSYPPLPAPTPAAPYVPYIPLSPAIPPSIPTPTPYKPPASSPTSHPSHNWTEIALIALGVVISVVIIYFIYHYYVRPSSTLNVADEKSKSLSSSLPSSSSPWSPSKTASYIPPPPLSTVSFNK